MNTPSRGQGHHIPKWFRDETRRRFRRERISLMTLGERLGDATGRDRPFPHPSLLRFWKGHGSFELADAFLALYVDLPNYVYFPRDIAEARAFEQVRLLANSRRRSPEMQDMLAAVDARAEIGPVDGAAGPRGVASRDGKDAKARGERKAARATGDARGTRRVETPGPRVGARRT